MGENNYSFSNADCCAAYTNQEDPDLLLACVEQIDS